MHGSKIQIVIYLNCKLVYKLIVIGYQNIKKFFFFFVVNIITKNSKNYGFHFLKSGIRPSLGLGI